MAYLLSLPGALSSRHTSLRPSMGNGRGGIYAAIRSPRPPVLERLMRSLALELRVRLGVHVGDEALVLRYGLGGVNWAHQDQRASPYQAQATLIFRIWHTPFVTPHLSHPTCHTPFVTPHLSHPILGILRPRAQIFSKSRLFLTLTLSLT